VVWGGILLVAAAELDVLELGTTTGPIPLTDARLVLALPAAELEPPARGEEAPAAIEDKTEAAEDDAMDSIIEGADMEDILEAIAEDIEAIEETDEAEDATEDSCDDNFDAIEEPIAAADDEAATPEPEAIEELPPLGKRLDTVLNWAPEAPEAVEDETTPVPLLIRGSTYNMTGLQLLCASMGPRNLARIKALSSRPGGSL
jgi:hypothetical protein